MINIYLPLIKEGVFRHADDSFRETILEWGRRGWVNVIRSDEPYVWWGEKGKYLLYDRDNFMWYHNLTPKYELMLCGCETLGPETHWTYWGRRPLNLENLEIIPFERRKFKSIFIGRIENEVQGQYRNNKEWGNYIELFDILVAREGLPYKYTNKEYLDLCRYSKFGLCLRGFGPKCHREVELMACGTIPIVTPGVDIKNYREPPIEGVHYISVNNPSEIPEKIARIDEIQWNKMSSECVAWYKRNCSIEGSFELTKRIISEYETFYRLPSSVSTIANEKCLDDLELFLFSLSRFHQGIKVYIGCDNFTKSYLESKKDIYLLDITIVTCLQKYSNIGRAEMERQGIWLDFMLEKATVMEMAIKETGDSLFIDSDVCILQSLPNVDIRNEVLLSPHLILKKNEDQFGKYNGGFFWTKHHEFCSWFRETSYQRSHYFEQQTLDFAEEKFKVGYFPMENNFGWWRLYECEDPKSRITKFCIRNGEIFYGNLPLRSIHTHFGEYKQSLTTQFNGFILNLLKNSTDQQELYKYIIDHFVQKVNVIIQTYNEPDENRRMELYYCLLQNLENPNIECIYNLYESADDSYLPTPIKSHKKYRGISGYQRLTYRDAFQFSNENLKGKICALINLDIMLDRDWDLTCLQTILSDRVILAQARHEIDLDTGKIYLDEGLKRLFLANSQDAWIYKAPIDLSETIDINFQLGLMGCDNAIADRLKNAGYIIFNMANRFKIIHLDKIRGKTTSNSVTYHRENEQKKSIVNTHPEQSGQFLVPNFDTVKDISIDGLLNQLGASVEKKVWYISQILSDHVKIKN